MTRLIAGSAGGRRITTPSGAKTRPTTDRVREAMFSRLASLVGFDDIAVLDLYAGSGALGLEAASRGARQVCCVESDPATARLIARNASTLDLSAAVAVNVSRVEQVVPSGPTALGGATAYDLVLADPPYPLGEDALEAVLQGLIEAAWLVPGAVVMVERSSRSPAPRWPSALAPLRSKKYGETTVHDAVHAGERIGPSPGTIDEHD